MSRSFAKSMYFCTVLIAALASITSGLSLEELNLKIERLERSNADLTLQVALQQNQIKEILSKNAVRIEELELKVYQLEAALDKQQIESGTLHNTAQQSSGTATSLGKQGNQRNALFRTCKEIYQADPQLSSGMYWIDPDGLGVGDDPIYVACDRITGKTSIPHDTEDPTEVDHCPNPGCYTRPIKYEASMRQMNALADLSSECHQSIRYECNYAPLETNGIAQSWWNDKNGVAQYFWSGGNNSIHTCQCGIDHNCIEPYYLCNCDSAVPVPLYDSGVITDKTYLPITQLFFGRTQLQTSSGVHTLGRFECTGQTSVNGLPKSCSDLWKIGHVLSGLYSVRGENNVEMLYCDFSKQPNESGFQKWIGLVDVSSLSVYFQVMRKNTDFSATQTPITFDTEILNTGRAMNTASGIFTAPRKGTYSFAFTALAFCGDGGSGHVNLQMLMNGQVVNYGHAHGITHDQASIHTTLHLQVGDRVWTQILDASCVLEKQWLHFTGWRLEEELTF